MQANGARVSPAYDDLLRVDLLVQLVERLVVRDVERHLHTLNMRHTCACSVYARVCCTGIWPMLTMSGVSLCGTA